MFAILGAVFSSFRIYLLIGIAAAAAGLVIYVQHLRLDAATAHAALAVVTAAHQNDMNTINTLQADRAADQAALTAMATAANKLNDNVSSIKDAINAIPEPKTCQDLDARDHAFIGGVRKLVNPGAPNPSH